MHYIRVTFNHNKGHKMQDYKNTNSNHLICEDCGKPILIGDWYYLDDGYHICIECMDFPYKFYHQKQLDRR